jgi:hypothetical protein
MGPANVTVKSVYAGVGMSPSDLPQPLHRFQGSRSQLRACRSVSLPRSLALLGKGLEAMPEADMLASFHEASNAMRESNITSDALAPASRAAVSAPRPSATNRAREIALQKRFDEETVRLLNNGNGAFHEAATMLIDELERRAERVISETGWDIQHGGATLTRNTCSTRRAIHFSCYPNRHTRTQRAMPFSEFDSSKVDCFPRSSARPVSCLRSRRSSRDTS